MTSQDPKELIRQLIDAHARADTARVREILSPELVWHSGGTGDIMGRDDYIQGLETGAKAFSDQEYSIEQLIGEDDRVAMLLTIVMRHTGEFQGIEPTGKSIIFASMWFYRISNGHIVEAWQIDENLVAKLEKATVAA